MPTDLDIGHLLTLHGVYVLVAVLVYVVSSHAVQQRRHPSAAIAWMLFILFMPYIALPAFLLFGFRKLARPASPVAAPIPRCQSWAVETIMALRQPAPAPYRELAVHQDGREARAALLEIIAAARHSIDCSTFLVGRDHLGDEVIDGLCAKARSGVHVRLLVDGFGHLMGGRPNLQRLAAAGGEFALFVEPLWSPLKGRTNLRNHRKMLLVDVGSESARLWCGGRNFASEYFEGEGSARPWHDLSFDLQGEFLQQAHELFERDWAFAVGRAPVPGAAVTTGQEPEPEFRHPPNVAQLVASGPDQEDDTVHELLLTSAYRARERIVIATPYFVPESALLLALCLAARRGVRVDLLLPARSNHRLSDLARDRALRSLALAGGHVWLAPTMLHAKLVVIDDRLALAGSTNLDSRSLFLNYELMVAFHDRKDVLRFQAWFSRECSCASAYAAKNPGLLRDVMEGMLLWLAFQL
ncbi:MAG: PLDc N-terminal domain-containing protein [Burkholderiaceae bacterium]|nr:PLDc N-terminal domain-containing protein [Burkholderiaceae bacterium]